MAKAPRPTRSGMAFVTAITQERRPIFEISRVAELFTETLLHYRTLGHYKLHAYVVLPDHVQLLLTPQSITLDQAVGLIRSGFEHRLKSHLPVWEQSYKAYSVANLHDLEIVRAYLHQLPVRAGFAPAAELYPHSSAYRQMPLMALPGGRPLAGRGNSAARASKDQHDTLKSHIPTTTSQRKRAS